MKKQIFVISLMLIAYSVFSQIEKTRNYQSSPYPNTIKTDEFIVLDINFDNNLVAFKHVFELRTNYDETGEIYEQACNCHYKGMEKKPLAGVVLGVYDLSKQEYLKTFTIYKAAYTKNECYDYKISLQKLDSAKQFFSKHKLDITKKPKAVSLNKQNLPKNSFLLNGIYFKYTNEKITSDDGVEMTTISKLYTYKKENQAKEKLIYTINQQDYYYMASGGEINYIAAYQKDGKFIFLNKFYHATGMAGETDRETYHFTPVLKFSELSVNNDFQSQLTNLPNPILVSNIFVGPSEYANYADAEIVTSHYRTEQLNGKDMIRFALTYELAENHKFTRASPRIKKDIIENKDKKKKFYIKYKTVKIMEGEAMSEPYQINMRIIEDYEIIGESPIILTFDSYYMGDLPIYTFKSKLGFRYDFDQIPENSYKLDKSDTEANPKFVGKKFKITYHILTEKDDYSERILDYYIIDKIELIKK